MNRAAVALGTNMGDRIQNLRAAVDAMNALPDTRVEAVSRVYETDPVGYVDQPDFLNTAARLVSSLSPEALLGALLGIEAAIGRRRTFPNAPRVIDLDLLLMETPEEQPVLRACSELTLPHPRMRERAFVLLPLQDVFPSEEACGLSFSTDLRGVSVEGVRFYAESGILFEKDLKK